jgi:hypothetical protein
VASAYLPFDLQPRNIAGFALAEIYLKMYVPDASAFFGVGHALAAFLAAFAGGGVALSFNRRASGKPAIPV